MTHRFTGQAARATERLGRDRLDKNMVIRCSEELYDRAQRAATEHDVSLSDYVRRLIIRDLESTRGSNAASSPPTV